MSYLKLILLFITLYNVSPVQGMNFHRVSAQDSLLMIYRVTSFVKDGVNYDDIALENNVNLSIKCNDGENFIFSNI